MRRRRAQNRRQRRARQLARRTLARDFDSAFARERLDRGDKIEVFFLHKKADGVAVRAAAEAMKHPLFRRDMKRRRFSG